MAYAVLAKFQDEDGNEYEMREDGLYMMRLNGPCIVWINRQSPLHLVDEADVVTDSEPLPPGTYEAQVVNVEEKPLGLSLSFELSNGQTFKLEMDGIKR